VASVESACVFCEIVAGRAEASTVLTTERVIAFMDANPATRGHLLVVPKAHADGLADLEPADGAEIFAVGQRLAEAVRRALGCTGVNLFLADGQAAGQEVFHAHLHVLPRYHDDGFAIRADFRTPPRGELEDVASVVRRALA
jgi:histidine triad (HIT) family protein